MFIKHLDWLIDFVGNFRRVTLWVREPAEKAFGAENSRMNLAQNSGTTGETDLSTQL
jgi:hypothetical protein